MSLVRDRMYRQTLLENIRKKVGSLTRRFSSRVGRSMGACRTYGTPTRSHSVGEGLQCHTCYDDGKRVLAADGGHPEGCDTLGCENEPVMDGDCAGCADILPGIINSDSDNDAPEEAHRAFDVSRANDEPDHEATKSPDSGSHSPVEGKSADTNPDLGFETDESAAYDHADREQRHAALASPQHALDDRRRKGGQG